MATGKPPSDKKLQQVLELPYGLEGSELIRILNERLRDIQEIFKAFAQNPTNEDLDIANGRILNLGDPKNDLDGVNLRTLRRFKGEAEQLEESVAVERQAYTAVFTKDGAVATDERSPSFTVNELRQGTPESCSLTCELAPSLTALQINWQVSIPIPDTDPPSYNPPENLLDDPLEIPIGEVGAVFTDDIGFSDFWTKGTKIRMVILNAASAQQVVGEIVVRRPAA